VWLTNVASGVLFTPWGVHLAMHQLAEQNFNTLYPVVWNRGNTFYESAVARRETGRSQAPFLRLFHLGADVLDELIKLGDRHHIRIIPWFEYGFMTPRNSNLAKLHPQWLSATQQNQPTPTEIPDELNPADIPNPPTSGQTWQQFLVPQNVWLNPLHPDVQDFILELIVELVSHYPIDGIQLDDHFGMPVESGYDSFTVELYRQEHQGSPPPENPFDAEWMRWRADKISSFMETLYRAIKSVNPDCIVSLSPNSQDFAYRKYLQDWGTWVERGWVDELLVQIYRNDLNVFKTELAQPAIQKAQQKIPVGIGILTGTLVRSVPIKQIQEQVQVVRDRRLDGVSFFYWETLWSYLTPESPPERRKAFRELFSQPTP
jgi:uncharacterized lipoprotein YddW (UPF0748 family)